MTRREKIKAIRKICGVKTHITWPQLCKLTEFDSFSTCFSFGFQWNEQCKDGRLVAMPDSYINMILFNVNQFPKIAKS